MHVAMLGYGTIDWDVFPEPCSGRELQVWGIARELARRGHDVTLVKAGDRNGMTTVDGVDIVSLKGSSMRSATQGFQNGAMMNEALSFSKRAAGYLKDLRPDALCLHYGLSSRYLAELAIPRSYTFHVADVMFSARRGVLWRDFVHYPHTIYTALLEQRSAEPANRLVALNEHMGSYLRQAWRRPVRVIPCGVDETTFRGRGDDRYVLFAGRIEWNKNVKHLIEAYAALPPRVRDEYQLKLVGSGGEESAVRELTERLGLVHRVEFIPWAARDRMASIIGSCSVLVLPSLVETFGIVLIEAMACGKPVLASDIPGPRNIVSPGYNGMLARPEDVGDLSRKLLHLLEDPEMRRRMGERGRTEVEARYTFRAVGGMYENILKEVVRETSKPAPLTGSPSEEAASVR
jgi:glycosyltransferase involved in cell wall biosynthesis